MAGRTSKGIATTPCPRCSTPVPVQGERGACPSCGLALRFVDVPERPCDFCGAALPTPPGKQTLRCARCGTWQGAEPGRRVAATTVCPRCRRRIPVELYAKTVACPHCGSLLDLADLPS